MLFLYHERTTVVSAAFLMGLRDSHACKSITVMESHIAEAHIEWTQLIITQMWKYDTVKNVGKLPFFTADWYSEMTVHYLLGYIDRGVEKLHVISQFRLSTVRKCHTRRNHSPNKTSP